MRWMRSWRADPQARAIADRHYNRQTIGARQFVPPGRCLVLKTPEGDALWVTSWPFARYVKHQWAGAWMNSTFRSENRRRRASALILDAVAATRFVFGDPPALGMVSFVDPKEVPAVRRRGAAIVGYSYLMAGFAHVGFTKAGLWAWQLAAENCPGPIAPLDGDQLTLRSSR